MLRKARDGTESSSLPALAEQSGRCWIATQEFFNSVGPGRWSGQSGLAGAREMFVAVPPGRDENPVRVFATFTEDLERLTDWLEQCGVTTVALESTGVYWIPLFEILEQRGIRPCLVNARHMKNVPGRRTDWHECQWLQFLHSVGLLRAAFRSGQDVCAVRTILRHRNEVVAAASQHVQHMHKALTQMSLQIHHVISDITGLTMEACRSWPRWSPAPGATCTGLPRDTAITRLVATARSLSGARKPVAVELSGCSIVRTHRPSRVRRYFR